MKTWSRPLGFVLVIIAIAIVYALGIGRRGESASDSTVATAPDPGYAARDAQVIETGYDGRERYRLNASVVRQQSDSGVIELENLQMDYHPDAQASVAGETPTTSKELWHMTSDRGTVRADGDDVQLAGNVRVSGTAPGTGDLLTLTTSSLRISTPTKFIETADPVKLRWAGHELDARGMQADLKAGTLSLKSDVHGKFSNK
jgi:LPS export ABC transporter protein LptC